MRMLATAVVAVLALAAPAAAHAAPTQLSSGLGCSADCIRSATVVPHPDRARIVVRTGTPARIQVVLREAEVAGAAGGGLTTGRLVASRSTRKRFTKVFGARVGNLRPDTLYAISVAATDAAGRKNLRTGTFRTPRVQSIGAAAGGGTLASGAGCAAQCIQTADATAGLRSALVRVHTEVPAKLQINPGGGAPGAATADYKTDATVSLVGLKPGRTYDVAVRATDADGGVSVRTGIIKMRHLKARVLLYEIDVSKAGEKRKRNRGELTFFGSVQAHWSAPYPDQGEEPWQLKRPEGKVKSGSSVHFENQGEVIVEDLRDSLSVRVQGIERDTKGTCFDTLGSGPRLELSGSIKNECITKTWSTAVKRYSAESLVKELPAHDDVPPLTVIDFVDERIEAEARGSNVRFKVDVRIEPWIE